MLQVRPKEKNKKKNKKQKKKEKGKRKKLLDLYLDFVKLRVRKRFTNPRCSETTEIF